MKDMLRKHRFFIIAFLIVCLVFSICSVLKQENTLFIDEIYSYGLANGHYTPFVKYIFDDQNMVDQVITKNDFQSYLSVDPGQRFDFGSVYYNQVHDVHPPLFYMILHSVSSLFPGSFSKWLGLSVNLICLMCSIILLYKLCLKLFHSKFEAVLAVCLYGLSTACIETSLMIRMYAMLTMFTLWLAYIISCLLEHPKPSLYILLFIDIFLGLSTQYYFVFYAFFVCLTYFVYTLIKKNYKETVTFSLSALSGVVLFVIAFPACITHLTGNGLVSGTNALENIMNFHAYLGRIYAFAKSSAKLLLGAVLLAVTFGVLNLFSFKKIKQAVRSKAINLDGLVIVVPAFITLIIVSIVSPIPAPRYIYNITPIFVVAAVYLCHLYANSVPMKNKHTFGFLTCIIAVLLLLLCIIRPDYMNTLNPSNNTLVSEHSNDPCIFFTDNYNCGISESMLQLMQFDSVLICNDPSSQAINPYLAQFSDSKECIVYMDSSEFWSENYDPDELFPILLSHTGFSDYHLLYRPGLASAYVID